MKNNGQIIAKAFDLCGESFGAAAVTDSEGRYVYVNSVWQSITGILAKDIIGKDIRSFPNIEGSCADAAINSARSLVSIVTVRKKNIVEKNSAGTKGTDSLIVRYRPLRDINGKVSGCIISQLCFDRDEALGIKRQIERFTEEKESKRGSKKYINRAKYTVSSIIGESAPMREVKRQIYIAAATSASCLIEGETGTGKELVAHAIHNAGSRKEESFVRVNCSAIPENLMESEFFGYEEGSFTGSSKGGKIGKFESANHGSMFLDEINAMDLTMQPKLLRALQEKEIERVGGTVSIPVDVRILSASNYPLEELIEKGSFRRDLFYRLNIITINIPPLRERKDDIPLLAESFISGFRNTDRGTASGITNRAMEYLMEYSWPGNVRELQNSIERAMASTMSDVLDIEHFQRLENHNEKDTFSKYLSPGGRAYEIRGPVDAQPEKNTSIEKSDIEKLMFILRMIGDIPAISDILRTMLNVNIDANAFAPKQTNEENNSYENGTEIVRQSGAENVRQNVIGAAMQNITGAAMQNVTGTAMQNVTETAMQNVTGAAMQNVTETVKQYVTEFAKQNVSENIRQNDIENVKLSKRGAKSLSEMKEESEKAAIIDALKMCNLNKSKAAKMLNISRTLLYKKLEKYNIEC